MMFFLLMAIGYLIGAVIGHICATVHIVGHQRLYPKQLFFWSEVEKEAKKLKSIRSGDHDFKWASTWFWPIMLLVFVTEWFGRTIASVVGK